MSSKNNVTFPNIWIEFEIEKQKYWIQDAEKCQENLIIDAMAHEFTRDEPLSIYSNIIENSAFIEKIRQTFVEIVQTGVCIVCMTKKNEKSVVVGIQCFEIASTVKRFESLRVGETLLQYMLKYTNICSKLNSQQYLVDRGLYVFPEYRKKGIACRLLECWSLICKYTGQELAIGIFSSKYSQAAARKAGFTESFFRSYEEIRKDLPSEIPLDVECHTKGLSLFIINP